MRASFCLLVAACCVARSFAGTLPSFIQPCKASDPKLNQCIEKVVEAAGPQFADGIPALGIAPLDPVQLGTVNVESNALNLVFTDTVVTGLRGFRINAFRINTEKGKASIDFTANVTLKAHYDMDGQVLILPIRGNGAAKIKITNLNIVIKYDYETKDGHWVVTSYRDSYKMDRAQFKFGNLFNGNKELASTIHTVINDNWEPVIRDIAPVAFEQIIKRCVDEAKKLFAAIPADQLLLP
ncbi:circadian clock-controlled protein daywake-like isoform X2 [Pectinophora gossypiella]|uniref:circadian clock-controlled protein daywake-like isoform X2 n=1 Tax=Pectinophora gossypiella TaxID=13191 RepID=UPI00214E43C4|nr:circadian clock-controlled protein daywake-like isoform X2 [Pectinophora gossypiella]